MCRPTPESRANKLDHWPGQPIARKTPPPGILKVVVGKSGIGGPPTVRRVSLGLIGRQRELERRKAVRCAPVALGPMQDEFLPGPPLEQPVQAFKVPYFRRIYLARVLQVDGPFQGLKVVIFDPLPQHFKIGRGIGPNDAVFSALSVKRPHPIDSFPPAQEVLRSSAAEFE